MGKSRDTGNLVSVNNISVDIVKNAPIKSAKEQQQETSSDPLTPPL